MTTQVTAAASTTLTEAIKPEVKPLDGLKIMPFKDFVGTDTRHLEHYYNWGEKLIKPITEEVSSILACKGKFQIECHATSYEYNKLDWRLTELQKKDLPPLCFKISHFWNLHEAQVEIGEHVKIVDVKVVYKKNTDKKLGSLYSSYDHSSVKLSVYTLVEVNGLQLPFIMDFKQLEYLFGLEIFDDLTMEIGGKKFSTDFLNDLLACVHYGSQDDNYDRNLYRFLPYRLARSETGWLLNRINVSKIDNIQALLRGIVKLGDYPLIGANLKGKGISKVYAKVKPIADSCLTEHPLACIMFENFANSCNRTSDSVKHSALFNQSFEAIADKSGFLAIMDIITSDDPFNYYSSKDRLEKLPAYKTLRKKAIKATTGRAFSKLMAEYEFLKLDEAKYPVTAKCLQDGDLPLNIFFRKKEQYFLLNSNFDLWEEMLTKHREVTLNLAKEASKRTTYEKDVMSYFYFVLYALPEYLEKHTGYKWTCMPRLVDSPNELEPPAADDTTGIIRKRSALTPQVDNEKHEVVVPYASLAMPGRQTTYCYSHNYDIVHRGFSFVGNVAMSDLEEKLNGRDDYGLMFYTLTGSFQGRGYPTFLIIFERLNSFGQGTRVHFHRTHPCRSKDGDYNPINDWVKVCYNWMAGNVNKNLIKNQQGDLIFVADDNENREYTTTVDVYDKHYFESSVKYAPYEKKDKDNVLGYVYLEKDNELHHSEHEDIMLPAGRYIIRQCRSWEASPSGIWTLRID